MLASLIQFSFLCIVALANLCLGFAIASRWGWCPPLAALFQLEPTMPTNRINSGNRELTTRDGAERPAAERPSESDAPESAEPSTVNKRASDDTGQSGDESRESDLPDAPELATIDDA